MRIVVVVLAGWAGSLVVAAGLFVALIRGGGGTDAGFPTGRPVVSLPAQRAPSVPAVPVLQDVVPVQRAGAEQDSRTAAHRADRA